jgi:hypothetical protein
MQEVCKVHKDSMAPHAAAITSAVLGVFPAVANDVSLSEGIQALLAELAACPGALPAMARSGVPLLMAQLRAAAATPAPRGAFLVEGTLDLLASFVSSSDLGAAHAVQAYHTGASLPSCPLRAWWKHHGAAR